MDVCKLTNSPDKKKTLDDVIRTILEKMIRKLLRMMVTSEFWWET